MAPGIVKRCAKEFLQDPEQEEEYDDEDEEYDDVGAHEEADENEEYDDDEEDIDEEYDDEEEEEEEEPRRTSRSKKGRNSDSPASDTISWNNVTVTYLFRNSLRDLAASPDASIVRISSEANGIFEPMNTRAETDTHDSPAPIPQKRSSNHLLGGMWITEYHNEFPVSIQMKVDGIYNTERSYTSEGVPGTFTFIKNTSELNVKISLNEGSGNANSPFLKQFPGWNLENIDTGITPLPNGDLSIIVANHPVIGMFNKAKIAKREAPFSLADQGPPGHFVASKADAEKCLKTIKENMKKHLQLKNLYDISLQLSRAFTSTGRVSSAVKTIGSETNTWSDGEEIFGEGISRKNGQQALLGEKNSLYVKILYKYAIV